MLHNVPNHLAKLAQACSTRRDLNRVPGIGLYFGAGQSYRFAAHVPVFVIMTPKVVRTYKGM